MLSWENSAACVQISSSAAERGSAELNDRVYLDGEASRQVLYADRGTGVGAAIAENGIEQVRSSVDDQGDLAKSSVQVT